jgi:hypothetical protein
MRECDRSERRRRHALRFAEQIEITESVFARVSDERARCAGCIYQHAAGAPRNRNRERAGRCRFQVLRLAPPAPADRSTVRIYGWPRPTIKKVKRDPRYRHPFYGAPFVVVGVP